MLHRMQEPLAACPQFVPDHRINLSTNGDVGGTWSSNNISVATVLPGAPFQALEQEPRLSLTKQPAFAEALPPHLM